MAEMRVGFIGLGRMGLPMCRRLLAAGFDLTVHDLVRAPVDEIVKAGGHAARSAAQATVETDIVLACLPDVAAVEEVFLEGDGIAANARPGQIVVDHSTVGLGQSRACAAAAAQKGATFLDAPISGGIEGARDGTLTIMAGGPGEAFQRALPVFQAMGTKVRHLGPTGSGTVAKLVNQLLVGIHSVAAAEALLLASKLGADPALVFEVVNSGWGHSFMLARNAPVMLDRRFEDARAPISTILKDLGLVQELTAQLESPALAADLAYRLFKEAAEAGLGGLDVPAVLLPMEQREGCLVQRLPGIGTG